MKEWLDKIEIPITSNEKYFYQIVVRLDEILTLLKEDKAPTFVKPIGTKDEPNEHVIESIIYEEDVDEILGDDMYNEDDDLFYKYNEMTVKELRSLAKEKGITGYSNLKKDELIDTLIKG